MSPTSCRSRSSQPSASALARRARFRPIGVAAAAVAVLACGRGGGEAAARDSSSATVAPPVPTAAAVGDSTCPNPTGRWDECNVRQRLERAGLAPRRALGEVRQPLFHAPGISYVVGRAELQVFLYPDSAALARDLASVDTARVQPRSGPPVAWGSTPTLMTSNNLVAVLLSDDATQVERVQLAMTAGLPAPTKKK